MEGDKAQNVKPDAKEKEVVKDAAKDAKEKKKEEAELSEEDRKLKTDLEMLVERLKGSDTALHRPSLETIRNEIRQSTSSVTAVPKPLKFLRPHFDTLKGVFTSMTDPTDKALASDVLSLLATTFEGNREALHYRLTGTSDSLGSWGHDYVRHLQGEIADEFQDYMAADPPKDVSALIKLADEMVAYDMKHNSEADACDLLMELDRLDTLIAHVDAKSYERVCLYLFSCVPYVPEPADANLLKICMQIFRKFEQWPQCLQMAMKLNDIELVKDVFRSCKDKSVRRQLAFMLGRQQIWFDLDEEDLEDDERVVLKSVISNSRLSENFLSLARELDIMEPKAPEDIYKTHLESYRGTGGVTVDSARGNLASAFVNAFVNSGFCVDKLVLTPPKANEWIYKNKDHGMMSATASLGMLMLWSVEDGLGKIDAHMFSDSEYVRAGALLAVGILNAGVRDENEPAMALLTDFVTDPKPLMRVGANMGLGLAYAGSANATVRELLENSVKIADDLEARAMAALALGQVYVGTCEPDIAFLLIDLLTNLSDKDLESPHARFIALGLGLLFLGKQKEAEVTLEILSTLKNPFKKIVTTLVEVCAYAGTGNVLKVQKLLHVCSEHVATKKDAEKAEEAKKEAASAGAGAGAAGDAAGAGAGDDAGNNPDAMAVDDKKEDEDEDEVTDTHQAFAVLGIALIGMAEEIGRDMAIRSFNHLLQYGEPVIRRAVPIGLAMLCVSNPLLPVLDTLSKLSHDPDAEVAYNSILAMGLVGAGTNQARIAGMLRQLAQYYSKDPNGLFVVRVAQGILHTGKGSITLSPYHTERTLMSPVAVSGLLAVLVSALDIKRVLLDKQHFMLYHLCLAMQPRILSTFHEDLTPAVTSVRVGLAVDVVGQAGKPKTITGFVTHNTPVLLGFGERAQLATEEYLPLTPMLEGFVILRKNPDFEKHD